MGDGGVSLPPTMRCAMAERDRFVFQHVWAEAIIYQNRDLPTQLTDTQSMDVVKMEATFQDKRRHVVWVEAAREGSSNVQRQQHLDTEICRRSQKSCLALESNIATLVHA